MDINDELKEIKNEIIKIKNEMTAQRSAAEEKLKNVRRIKEEIEDKIRMGIFIECQWCEKLFHRSKFHIITKLETKIECVYEDYINSGGNEYAIVERENTYVKCPKCNKLTLNDTVYISEGKAYGRNYAFTGFNPTSEIISSTEDPQQEQEMN